jgi:hypothetical protein
MNVTNLKNLSTDELVNSLKKLPLVVDHLKNLLLS